MLLQFINDLGNHLKLASHFLRLTDRFYYNETKEMLLKKIYRGIPFFFHFSV